MKTIEKFVEEHPVVSLILLISLFLFFYLILFISCLGNVFNEIALPK